MRKKFNIFFISLKRSLMRNSLQRVMSGPLQGMKWKIAIKDNTYLLGSYEEEALKELCGLLKPGMTALDIGANTGYFSLAFSRAVGPSGKIYSFEPLPANFTLLQEHLRLNGIANVFASELCIAAKGGETEFSSNVNAVANTFIVSSPVFQNSSRIRVKTASLDELLSTGRITAPSLIKIDVEGAEYEVLQGAIDLLTSWKPILFIATHNNHQAGVKEKCIEFLEAKGYQLRSISKNAGGEMEDFIALPSPLKK
jgi:FkbM family methyltransferase